MSITESFTEMIYNGDCLDILPELDANSVDAVVTDPPYGLSFMGKDWDHGVPGTHFWTATLRVMKPGAFLLSFGGTRTFHRLTCAIEDAGFEIRDCMMWLYGSGFPKSHDVSKAIDKAAGAEREVIGQRDTFTGRDKEANTFMASPRLMDVTAPSTDAARQWSGWGTALKPAWEPIIVARKPLEGTVAENVLKWGTGGMNIDGGRVGTAADLMKSNRIGHSGKKSTGNIFNATPPMHAEPSGLGRWPANVILDEEVTTESWSRFFMRCKHDAPKHDKMNQCKNISASNVAWFFGTILQTIVDFAPTNVEDSQKERLALNVNFAGIACGSCATLIVQGLVATKSLVSNREGLRACLASIGNFNDDFLIQNLVSVAKEWDSTGTIPTTQSLLRLFGCVLLVIGKNTRQENPENDNAPLRFKYTPKASKRERGEGNNHPTVKPISLLTYLAKLVCPPGGVILDPFMGSGSMGVAAQNLGFDFIGIEKEKSYCDISNKRMSLLNEFDYAVNS